MNQFPIKTGFDRLLSLLDSDRERAGEKYELLRQRLIRFFEWRNCETAEELTDVTFDRVERKIEEGEEILNVSAYAGTVAQFVYKEYLRKNERQNQLIEDSPEVQKLKTKNEDQDEIGEKRRNCLEICLTQFSDENRHFIIAYYDTDEKTMINARKRLAEEMNSNLNALRIRACRLKAKLEDCVFACCDK